MKSLHVIKPKPTKYFNIRRDAHTAKNEETSSTVYEQDASQVKFFAEQENLRSPFDQCLGLTVRFLCLHAYITWKFPKHP